VIPSKLVTTLHAGDRVVFETAGGGGYGDPANRDEERLRADLADGKVSREEAAASYGVTPSSEEYASKQ
jgi:N-methylhydantoinase B